MKIPQFVQELFDYVDHIDRNGIIEQEEIDSFKGSGTVFDPNEPFYNIKPGMSIYTFVRENESSFRACVQYTDNEYKPGRKLLNNNKLISTDMKRKTASDDEKSLQVEQGQYAIKKYSKDTQSLKVYNVCNCVAVTIYDKKTKRGFITHIDTAERAESLEKVLKDAKFNPKTTEVRIIGGITGQSEGTVEIIEGVIKNFNLPIVEYDILGEPIQRNIILDLKTGEVFDYKENNEQIYVEEGGILGKNKESD